VGKCRKFVKIWESYHQLNFPVQFFSRQALMTMKLWEQHWVSRYFVLCFRTTLHYCRACHVSSDIPPHLHLTTSKVMVIVWRLRRNIIRTVLYCQRATSSMGTVDKNSSYSPVRPWVCLFVFFRLHDLSLCWCWTVESFLFMLWRWRNKLKWAPFELFTPSPLLRIRSWLRPFKGHCEQKAMRDKGVIYVAGHPLPNRRCTRLPGCFYFPKRKLYVLLKALLCWKCR